MFNLRRHAAAFAAVALVSLAVLAPINPPSARADSGGNYAAIAYSPQTGRYGFTHGYSCLQDAENDAVANACAPDAQVVVWVQHGYAALAVRPDGAYGDAWSTVSLADAEARALTYAGGGRILAWAASG